MTSFGRIETTRWLPFTKSQYVTLVAAAALPLLLVTLRDIPLLELLRRIKGVIG
ncbi:MAG TPA: hypothetical protein VIL20_22690 [Sandaracinaceae bacterium]